MKTVVNLIALLSIAFFIAMCGIRNSPGIIISAMLIGVSTVLCIELDTPKKVKRGRIYVESMHKLPKQKP